MRSRPRLNLIRPDLRVANDLAPPCHLEFEPIAEFFRGICYGSKAQGLQPLLDIRCRDHLHDSAAPELDNVLRRAGRSSRWDLLRSSHPMRAGVQGETRFCSAICSSRDATWLHCWMIWDSQLSECLYLFCA
jgi:hypothetical protein